MQQASALGTANEAFIDYRSECLPDETMAGTTDEVTAPPRSDDVMKNRIHAYKKVTDDVPFILEASNRMDAEHNPLAVRAWFFNIGLAFDKVRLIQEATDQPHCESREERVEKILEAFRRQNIVSIAANTIRTREPAYSLETAREKTEKLVRDAFRNSIAR